MESSDITMAQTSFDSLYVSDKCFTHLSWTNFYRARVKINAGIPDNCTCRSEGKSKKILIEEDLVHVVVFGLWDCLGTGQAHG